jgi:hypothetical protein
MKTGEADRSLQRRISSWCRPRSQPTGCANFSAGVLTKIWRRTSGLISLVRRTRGLQNLLSPKGALILPQAEDASWFTNCLQWNTTLQMGAELLREVTPARKRCLYAIIMDFVNFEWCLQLKFSSQLTNLFRPCFTTTTYHNTTPHTLPLQYWYSSRFHQPFLPM